MIRQDPINIDEKTALRFKIRLFIHDRQEGGCPDTLPRNLKKKSLLNDGTT